MCFRWSCLGSESGRLALSKGEGASEGSFKTISVCHLKNPSPRSSPLAQGERREHHTQPPADLHARSPMCCYQKLAPKENSAERPARPG